MNSADENASALRGFIETLKHNSLDPNGESNPSVVAAIHDTESALTELELANDSTEKRREHLVNFLMLLNGARGYIVEAIGSLDKSSPKG